MSSYIVFGAGVVALVYACVLANPVLLLCSIWLLPGGVYLWGAGY